MSKAFSEEFELLNSIYTEDEVSLVEKNGKEASITMNIHAATAGIETQQYVSITLKSTIPNQYPKVSPAVIISSSRGLADAELNIIMGAIEECLKDNKGDPVLMQIYQTVQERLTDSNIPHGCCTICHCDFGEESGEFLKTECYHYFHNSCLSRYKKCYLERLATEDDTPTPSYLVKQDKQFICPVCREVIDINIISDYNDEDVTEEQFVYQPDHRMLKIQEEWRKLYDKQLKQGGIINEETNTKKFYLNTETMEATIGTKTTVVKSSQDNDNEKNPSQDNPGQRGPEIKPNTDTTDKEQADKVKGSDKKQTSSSQDHSHKQSFQEYGGGRNRSYRNSNWRARPRGNYTQHDQRQIGTKRGGYRNYDSPRNDSSAFLQRDKPTAVDKAEENELSSGQKAKEHVDGKPSSRSANDKPTFPTESNSSRPANKAEDHKIENISHRTPDNRSTTQNRSANRDGSYRPTSGYSGRYRRPAYHSHTLHSKNGVDQSRDGPAAGSTKVGDELAKNQQVYSAESEHKVSEKTLKDDGDDLHKNGHTSPGKQRAPNPATSHRPANRYNNGSGYRPQPAKNNNYYQGHNHRNHRGGFDKSESHFDRRKQGSSPRQPSYDSTITRQSKDSETAHKEQGCKGGSDKADFKSVSSPKPMEKES